MTSIKGCYGLEDEVAREINSGLTPDEWESHSTPVNKNIVSRL